jgi:hypothetical protein
LTDTAFSASSGDCVQVGAGGLLTTTTGGCGSASTVPFSGITSGDNTTAAMTVDTGASLTPVNSGIIEANELAAGTYGNALIFSNASDTFAGLAASATTAVTFTGPLAGDVTGTQSATVVSSLQGVPLVASVAAGGAAPTTGQVLEFNGTDWVPSTALTGITVPWSSITAPTAALSLTMPAGDTTAFTWANQTTTPTTDWTFTAGADAASTAPVFSFTDTTGNARTGPLFNINTAAGSTALPLQVTALGTANGVAMDVTGDLKAIGSGAITATTATALAATPTPCTAGLVVTGIAANGTLTCSVPASASSVAFSGIATGANTTAAMTVGSGASLEPVSGSTGIIDANYLQTGTTPVPVANVAPTAGMVLTYATATGWTPTSTGTVVPAYLPVYTAGTTTTSTTTGTPTDSTTTLTLNFAGGPTASENFGTTSYYVSLSSTCSATTSTACDDTTLTWPGNTSSTTTTVNGNTTTTTTTTTTTINATISGVMVTLSAAATESHTVQLYLNGAAVGSTCTIATGATSCTIASAYTATANDPIEVRVSRTSSTSQTLTVTTAATETSYTTATTVTTVVSTTTTGTQLTTPLPHMVVGSVTIPAIVGTASLGVATLTMPVPYTSVTSYWCTAQDITGYVNLTGLGIGNISYALLLSNSSTTVFTISGNPGDTANFQCMGN